MQRGRTTLTKGQKKKKTHRFPCITQPDEEQDDTIANSNNQTEGKRKGKVGVCLIDVGGGSFCHGKRGRQWRRGTNEKGRKKKEETREGNKKTRRAKVMQGIQMI
jgi:hypothetical protein